MSSKPPPIDARYRINGRFYRVTKTGATIDGKPGYVLLACTTQPRDGSPVLIAKTVDELRAIEQRDRQREVEAPLRSAPRSSQQHQHHQHQHQHQQHQHHQHQHQGQPAPDPTGYTYTPPKPPARAYKNARWTDELRAAEHEQRRAEREAQRAYDRHYHNRRLLSLLAIWAAVLLVIVLLSNGSRFVVDLLVLPAIVWLMLAIVWCVSALKRRHRRKP